jgi:CxxC motif-containing protein (DUF1111 family)
VFHARLPKWDERVEGHTLDGTEPHEIARLFFGRGLADGITQGGASPDEFRTAPLWGVGQRVFFLHDGRTSNLVEAIEAHKSHDSEANTVIDRFNTLTAREQQDIINFLRSL